MDLLVDGVTVVHIGSGSRSATPFMDTIGLKELRQHASDYVKRAEAGETLLITVSGRPGAVLGPASEKQWNRYSDIEDVFDTPTDHTLADDLAEKNDTVQDPWTR